MRKSAVSPASAANAMMCALVALYSAFVLTLVRGQAVPLPVFSAAGAGLLLLYLMLSRRYSAMGLSPAPNARFSGRRVFLWTAGFSLLVSLVYLLAFFPGGFSSDTTTQWHQLRGELPLSDWHPALHTLLLWLITRICEHPAFVLLIQALCYAAAVGYACRTMYCQHVPGPAVLLTALYLSGNPAFSNILAFPWKDCAFAICVLFLSAQLFAIHCSQGEWLRRRARPLALALTLALCAILRHNGIALSLAAGAWLLLICPRLIRHTGRAVLFAAVLFALIKGPLYNAAGVEKNATPLDETIGLPMTVLSHIYVNQPDALAQDAVAFLETLATRDAYAASHCPGDWNATKWTISALPADHGYSLAQVFVFAAKAGIAAPSLAIEALAGLFDLPMLPAGEAFWRMSPYTEASAAQFGFMPAHQPFFSRALNWLCRFTASPALSWLFWRPGIALLLIMLACVCFARRRALTSLTIPAMLIAYHLATSVMLSSPTDFRFFLPTLMAAPLAVIALAMKAAPPSHRQSQEESK